MISTEVIEWLKTNKGFQLTLTGHHDQSITVRIHRWDDPYGRGEPLDRTYGFANSGPNGDLKSTIEVAWLQARTKVDQ